MEFSLQAVCECIKKVDDTGLDCQFVPLEQIVRMQPVFELVATDVHRTIAFR